MRPEARALYPENWTEISRRIKEERGNRCEGCGQIGDKISYEAGGNNYLTVHHIDYDPANCDPINLIVLCQKCHLRLQQGELPRLLKIKAGQLILFE
jgi:hypothetical protein